MCGVCDSGWRVGEHSKVRKCCYNKKIPSLLCRIGLLSVQSGCGKVLAFLLAQQDNKDCVKINGSKEEYKARKREGETMKRFLALLCTLTLTASMLAGCGTKTSDAEGASQAGSAESAQQSTETEAAEALKGQQTDTESESDPEMTAVSADVNVVALKGPTAMGMVSFMDQAESGTLTDHQYHFSIAAAVDEVTPMLVKGEADIAAVPANLASVLYNNTEGGIQVMAVNTLGVLYMVGTGEALASAEELKGRTIYASGKGATPEYALNYILSENGIDPEKDVTIEWKSEHAECLSALLAEDGAIAMLPQPFVTTAQTKNDKIQVLLDLNKEWDKLQENSEQPSALLTGVVVVRKEFAEQNPEAVSAFLDHYKASVDYVNSNTKAAAELIGRYEIVSAEIAEKALPACNITYMDGEELQSKLSGYLSVLFEQNPKSVGGALPSDDFYYSR